MKHTVYRHDLKNGMRVLLIDVPQSTHFDMAIALNSGYRQATVDDQALYELPHILEHMVFDGSKKYPSGDALQEAYSMGAGESNGITSPYNNLYVFQNRPDNAAKIIDAAFDMVYRPLLTEDSFNEEMHVIENELGEYMGDFQLNAAQYTQQQILPDLIISSDTQLGRLVNVTYQAAVDYHKKYYGTANTTIVIATNFKKASQADLLAAIEAGAKGVPKLKRYDIPTFDYDTDHDGAPRFMPIGKSIDHSIVSLQYMIPGVGTMDDMDRLGLFRAMASSMKSYSVNHQLRKRGLVYGLEVAGTRSVETYGLEFAIDAPNSKIYDVVAQSLALTRDLARTGISDAAFEELKKGAVDSIDDAIATPGDIMGWYLDGFLIEDRILDVKQSRADLKKITQRSVLDLVQKILTRDNQFGTVFSAKPKRVTASLDSLTEAILADDAAVTPALMEKLTVPTNFFGAYWQELNTYYDRDPDAGPYKAFLIGINTRPWLAYPLLVVTTGLGILLTTSFIIDRINGEPDFTILHPLVGLYLVANGIMDVIIRIQRQKRK